MVYAEHLKCFLNWVRVRIPVWVQWFFEIWRYLNNWFSCLALQAGGTGSSPVTATN